ncbi:hypothetical protein GOP47_0016090, partial [Adiantum capillus-veneris]
TTIIHELRPCSNGAEYVGFEFSTSCDGFDSIEERMLPADELFCDGKLRPLGENFEWMAPRKPIAKAHLVAGDAASCLPPSPPPSSSPFVGDAVAAEGPEAGPFGSLQTGKESTNPFFCADERAFNSSEWICFSPSPTFSLQAENGKKADDTENMVASNGYSLERVSHAEKRACLSPLPINCIINLGPEVAGQRRKPEKPATSIKQALPSAGKGQQVITKHLSSNHPVARAMAVARARRLMDASRAQPKLAQSNLPASADPSTIPQVSCCLKPTSTSSSSSSSSSTSTTLPVTRTSHPLTSLLRSSPSPSTLASSLLSTFAFTQPSTFFTSPSSSVFLETPSSPPFFPFATSSTPSSYSCSSSSSLFSDSAKKHPSLSSPSSRSTYCSCSCRFGVWALWPFSKYKESIYSCMESPQYVSLNPQDIERKTRACLASKEDCHPLKCQVSSKVPAPQASHSQFSPHKSFALSNQMLKEMQHRQHAKAAITGMNGKYLESSSKHASSPTMVVNNEQRQGSQFGQLGKPKSSLHADKSSPRHSARAEKRSLSGGGMAMQMGFREYTRKKCTYSPTVRVTPILSIVPGCMGPSLSKTRPSVKPAKASF